MTKEYQVTLTCATNKYKPVSCIIKNEQTNDEDLSLKAEFRKPLEIKGIKKICLTRRWSGKDLKNFGYVKCKIRAYNRETMGRK